MRLLVILLFYFTISSCNSQTTDNGPNNSILEPIEIAKGIAKRIINGNKEFEIDTYFNKDELGEFLRSIKPAAPESAIEKEIDNYDANLKEFKTNYANNFKELNLSMSGCAEIDWKKCSIDSTTYQYRILIPQGLDQKVTWPESKEYTPNSGQMTCCDANVFISEQDKECVMQIEFWIFHNEGKFYNNLKAPRIIKIK